MANFFRRLVNGDLLSDLANRVSLIEKRTVPQVNVNTANIESNIQYIEEIDSDLETLEVQVNDLEIQVNELKAEQIKMQSDIELLRAQIGGGDPGPTYPAEENPDTINWDIIPYSGVQPDGSVLPGYLVPFADAETGYTITRIGDQSAFGVTGNQVQHNYSSNQSWNADETLVKLNTPNQRILSTVDWSVQYVAAAPAYHQWSNSDPKKMYGTSGNAFVIFDVDTNIRTTLRSFSAYTNLSIGSGEGRLSQDDRYVVLEGTRNGAKWLISYDILTDTVIAELELPAGDLDFATISESGNYVIVSWRPDGSGINQGFKVYDRDLTNLRHVWNYTGHGDCGFDVDGNEVFVQFANQPQWNNNRYLEMIQLDNGTVTGLYYDSFGHNDTGVWGGHISCRNINRPGWAYVTEGRASDDVMANTIFAIKLSATDNVVERYGRHHSARVDYQHEAQGTVNRDGTKIMFKSNWYHPTLMGWTAAPSFVLEI